MKLAVASHLQTALCIQHYLDDCGGEEVDKQEILRVIKHYTELQRLIPIVETGKRKEEFAAYQEYGRKMADPIGIQAFRMFGTPAVKRYLEQSKTSAKDAANMAAELKGWSESGNVSALSFCTTCADAESRDSRPEFTLLILELTCESTMCKLDHQAALAGLPLVNYFVYKPTD